MFNRLPSDQDRPSPTHQPTSSSRLEKPSPSDDRIALAAERADFLLRQYRSGLASDPKVYAVSVAAILAQYPEDTILYVTDPVTGIAANPIEPRWTGLPDLAHVKQACENHDGPIRRRLQNEERLARQLEERALYQKQGRLPPPAGRKLISFKEFEKLGGSRPIGYFEDPSHPPPGCKPLKFEEKSHA